MTTWTLLLCEGGHDQAALLGWLSASGWTRHEGAPDGLPPALENAYPQPMRDRRGRTRTDKAPDYVRRNDAWIEIRSLQSESAVLGRKATELLDAVRDALYGVGVFVDADGRGVSARQEAFRQAYGRLFAHAAQVQAGCVADGPPKLGLWVAPDNQADGALSTLLRESGRLAKPDLFSAASCFETAVAPALPRDMAAENRLKIILGAAGQTDAPGGSLATALRTGTWWFTPGFNSVPAVAQMIEFIEMLVPDATG